MSTTNDIDPFILRSTSDPDLLKTRSRLRVWWLCKFNGFRVVSVSQLPETTLIGGIRYARTWWLAPRSRNGGS